MQSFPEGRDVGKKYEEYFQNEVVFVVYTPIEGLLFSSYVVVVGESTCFLKFVRNNLILPDAWFPEASRWAISL